MTNNIKNQLAIMSERVSPSPSHNGHLSLAELRAYQSAWLDGAFAALALISRDVRSTPFARATNNNEHKEQTDEDSI